MSIVKCNMELRGRVHVIESSSLALNLASLFTNCADLSTLLNSLLPWFLHMENGSNNGTNP